MSQIWDSVGPVSPQWAEADTLGSVLLNQPGVGMWVGVKNNLIQFDYKAIQSGPTRMVSYLAIKLAAER